MPSQRRVNGRYNFSKVWERDYGICQYCGFPGEAIDHVVPWAYIPDNSMDNLVVACMLCNLAAGGKVFDCFRDKRDFILVKRRPEIERMFLEHQAAEDEREEEEARTAILALESEISSVQDCPGAPLS